MTLEDLGYRKILDDYRRNNNLSRKEIGRIISEHKENYMVKTERGEFYAELTGKLRFSAKSRAELPAVGDWVSISEYDTDKSLIHSVFPRMNILERRAVGKFAEKQIIASNIDCAFIIQSVEKDFNINRLERYLTICYSSGINAKIILNKIDLINSELLDEMIRELTKRIKEIQVIALSNITKSGFVNFYNTLEERKTYCLLGSSGVGKSTLLNQISGKHLLKTTSVNPLTKRGLHTTTNKELLVLKNGSIFIDTPGLREVGITEKSEGIDITFGKIIQLSENCKFKDCSHTHEKGCSVKKALDTGELDRLTYENFLKMNKEKSYFESDLIERRKKDKQFGKMIKNIKKLDKG